MTAFGQHLMSGLALGSVYALLALGLVLVYRATKVVSFVHGTIATLAVYIAYALRSFGLPIAFLSALVGAFAAGMVTDRCVSKAQNRGHDAQMLVTIALFMVGDGLLAHVFGADVHAFEHLFSELIQNPLFASTPLSSADALTVGVAGLAAGLLAFLMRTTRTGLHIRALGDNPEAAALMGLPVARLRAVTWGLSAVLGAIAGLLLVPRLYLEPGMMFSPLLKAFAGAVLGGFGSFGGALLGALLLGVAEVLSGVYVSTDLQSSLPFLVLFVGLIVRPAGLMGRVQRRRL